MIFDYLIPHLKEKFPNGAFLVAMSPRPNVVFPAVHSEVGNIEVCDDGNELTLYLGKFTHCHYSNYEEGLTTEQKEKQIAEETIEFLGSLFADQIVFWGSHDEGGGCYHRDDGQGSLAKGKKKYVWSGPLIE